MPAASAAITKAGEAIREALPSAERAKALFNSIENQIGDQAVDVSKAGDTALAAQDWANSGGQSIKQIRDVLRRTTDPKQGDLTFTEARQFLSNAGRRLSASEVQNLPPRAQAYLSQFASDLNTAVREVADNAGLGDEYTQAVDNFRGANAWQSVKSALTTEAAKTVIKYGIGGLIGGAAGAGGWAIARKYLPE